MGDSAIEFIEAWTREHITVARYEPSCGTARAEELAKWLRGDAAIKGISDAAIDAAIAGLIGAGHGLVSYIATAMARVAITTVVDPQTSRITDEDFPAHRLE